MRRAVVAEEVSDFTPFILGAWRTTLGNDRRTGGHQGGQNDVARRFQRAPIEPQTPRKTAGRSQAVAAAGPWGGFKSRLPDPFPGFLAGRTKRTTPKGRNHSRKYLEGRAIVGGVVIHGNGTAGDERDAGADVHHADAVIIDADAAGAV